MQPEGTQRTLPLWLLRYQANAVDLMNDGGKREFPWLRLSAGKDEGQIHPTGARVDATL